MGSMLTALDEIYPICVCIREENKSEDTWTWFLERLKRACPCLTSDHPLDRVEKKKYTFISDRDKGLVESLDKHFPSNMHLSCSVHIQRNVQVKFGRNAAKLVPQITKTFSSRHENALFGKLESINQGAATYLKAIEPCRWRSAEWTRDTTLPPRYGITASNASESLNNMFNSARNTTWLDALDVIFDKMTSRISEGCSSPEDGIGPEVWQHTSQQMGQQCCMQRG